MERQTDQLTNAGLKVIKKAYLRAFSSGEPKMTYCKCMFMIFLIPPPPPPPHPPWDRHTPSLNPQPV